MRPVAGFRPSNSLCRIIVCGLRIDSKEKTKEAREVEWSAILKEGGLGGVDDEAATSRFLPGQSFTDVRNHRDHHHGGSRDMENPRAGGGILKKDTGR